MMLDFTHSKSLITKFASVAHGCDVRIAFSATGARADPKTKFNWTFPRALTGLPLRSESWLTTPPAFFPTGAKTNAQSE